MKRRQSGFTLVEVVVAFALLGAALALLLASLSGALGQVRHSDGQGRAALYAQSLLDGLGSDVPLAPGERHGQWENGKFRWQLVTRPYSPPDARSGAAADLLELELHVQWGETSAQALQWRTLRWVAGAQE